MRIERPPLLLLNSWPGGWWFRVLGFGLHAKDRRRNYRTYKERHGRRRPRIGNWVFRGLGR